MHTNLLKNTAIDFVNALVTAGSSIDDNSSILDMSGWEGVIFAVTITDSVATGVATLTAQGSAANADGAMAAITNAAATATCAVNDDLNSKLLIVDVYRPLLRYIQGTLSSATANIAYGETIAIRYNGRKAPITQDTDTVAGSAFTVGS